MQMSSRQRRVTDRSTPPVGVYLHTSFITKKSLAMRVEEKLILEKGRVSRKDIQQR